MVANEKAPATLDTSGGMADTGRGADVAQGTCKIEGCERDSHSKGWCQMHYTRWNRHGDPLTALLDRSLSLAERFWAKVARGEPDECWEWGAHRTLPWGYGQFGIGARRTVVAHRQAFELAIGPIPDGLFVLHSCDNPPCCNPAHLFLGTHADNMADRDAKGRCPRGEAHHTAKLSTQDVAKIRAAARGGSTHTALAAEYGVSRRTIGSLVAGKTYADTSSPRVSAAHPSFPAYTFEQVDAIQDRAIDLAECYVDAATAIRYHELWRNR